MLGSLHRDGVVSHVRCDFSNYFTLSLNVEFLQLRASKKLVEKVAYFLVNVFQNRTSGMESRSIIELTAVWFECVRVLLHLLPVLTDLHFAVVNGLRIKIRAKWFINHNATTASETS